MGLVRKKLVGASASTSSWLAIRALRSAVWGRSATSRRSFASCSRSRWCCRSQKKRAFSVQVLSPKRRSFAGTGIAPSGVAPTARTAETPAVTSAPLAHRASAPAVESGCRIRPSASRAIARPKPTGSSRSISARRRAAGVLSVPVRVAGSGGVSSTSTGRGGSSSTFIGHSLPADVGTGAGA